MNRSEVVVLDFQYLRGNGSQIFVKELAFTRADSTNIILYLFMPPFSSQELTHSAQRSNDYCSKQINLLNWDDGVVPYTALKDILDTLNGYEAVFVQGEEKKKFLSQYLRNVQTISTDISYATIPNYYHECLIHSSNFKCCAWHHVRQLQFFLERMGVYDY